MTTVKAGAALTAMLLCVVISVSAKTATTATAPARMGADSPEYWLRQSEAEIARMADAEERSSALAILGGHYIAIGRLDRAKAIAAGLPRQHRGGLFYHLIVEQALKGDIDAAIATARSAGGISTTSFLLRPAIRALAYSGHADKAEALVKFIDSVEGRSGAHKSIACAHAVWGDLAAAQRIAESVTDKDHKSYVSRWIAAARIVESGKPFRRTFSNPVVNLGDGVNYEDVAAVAAMRIEPLVEQGKLQRAKELTAQLADPTQQANGWRAIARAQLERGDKISARRSVAKVSFQVAEVTRRLSTEEDALEKMQLGAFLRAIHFGLAELQAQLGDFEAAKVNVAKSHSQFDEDFLKGPVGSSRFRSDWCHILLECSKVREAQEQATGPDGQIRPELRAMFITALARQGKMAEARQLADMAKGPAARAACLQAVAIGLAQRKKAEKEKP